MFPYKTKQLQTHTCIFLLGPQHSQISATKGGRLKEHAWERPLSAAQGSSCSGFSDECATRRPLTSLEEKIKVCERPDRLGSATNPEMSELGLPGLESSMKEKLWNKWKQGMHLPKNNTWPNSSGETNTTSVQGEHCALSHHYWSMIEDWTGYWEQVSTTKTIHHQTTTIITILLMRDALPPGNTMFYLLEHIWLIEWYSGLFFQTQMRIWCKYL